MATSKIETTSQKNRQVQLLSNSEERGINAGTSATYTIGNDLSKIRELHFVIYTDNTWERTLFIVPRNMTRLIGFDNDKDKVVRSTDGFTSVSTTVTIENLSSSKYVHVYSCYGIIE